LFRKYLCAILPTDRLLSADWLDHLELSSAQLPMLQEACHLRLFYEPQIR
jgi:hypothetical protein